MTITKSDRLLKSYSGPKLDTVGNIEVKVTYGDFTKELPLVVINQGKDPDENESEHLRDLEAVFHRLNNYGIQLNLYFNISLKEVIKNDDFITSHGGNN